MEGQSLPSQFHSSPSNSMYIVLFEHSKMIDDSSNMTLSTYSQMAGILVHREKDAYSLLSSYFFSSLFIC